MKSNKQDSFYLTLVIALSLLFISIFYGKVLINPNQYTFSNSGDGIKNYYTFAYYIENNHSKTNFEGLNYPYGENFMYTDCHPVIAYSIKSISNYFPVISDYKVGIINFLMIISFLLEALFLYLIFKNIKINLLFAVYCSVAITILSPQIFRMTGHYALSYGFFIPLTIYLLLKFELSKQKKYLILLLLNNIFWFFIHSYLGLMATGFLLLFGLMKLYQDIKVKNVDWKNQSLFFSQILVPIILFYLFVKTIDIHTGRTKNPYGFFEYRADFDTILLPNQYPLKYLTDLFLPQFTQTWEGLNYIGFVAVFGSMMFVFFKLKKRVESSNLTIKPENNKAPFLKFSLISSAILLLFSVGFPFRFGLESFLEYFPILKQFRAIGRFSWVFFFIINIEVVYYFNSFLIKYFNEKRKVLSYSILIIIPFIIGIEGISYHLEISRTITQQKNIFDIKQIDKSTSQALKGIESNNYQAIIPLPFYNIGSENFGKIGTSKTYYLSMLFSYHLKLPILGNYLTRISIKESRNVMQILSNSFYAKEIAQDITSKKPFLLICSNEKLTENEQTLLNKSHLIKTNEKFSIYEISAAELFENTAKKEFEAYFNAKPHLIAKEGFLFSDTSNFFFYNDFENLKNKITHSGKGSLILNKKGVNKIVQINSFKLDRHKKYTATFWIYNKGQDRINNCEIILKNSLGNKIINLKTYKPMESETISGDWSMMKMNFSVSDEKEKVTIAIEGFDINNSKMFIDDILICEEQTTVYRELKVESKKVTELFKNNHFMNLDRN